MNNPRSRSWRPPIHREQSRAFTTDQAIGAGLTKRQVGYRIQAGIFVRVAGNALRHRDDPVSPEMLAYAAHLTWPDAILCGPTAAQLFGLSMQDYAINSSEVHVIVQDKRKPRFNLVPHKYSISHEEWRHWQGIRVSTKPRSVIDSFRLLPLKDALSLFVWVFTRDLLTVADLDHYLQRYPGHLGNRRLRLLASNARDGIMSPAEGLAQGILKGAGIRGWVTNVPIVDWSGIIARADILFPKHRLIIEIDGRQFHGADSFQSDRTRGNRLQEAGYVVLHFTWQDLTHRSANMVDQIREILARK